MSCMYVYATLDHQLLYTIGRTFRVREIVKLKKTWGGPESVVCGGGGKPHPSIIESNI